MSEDTQYSKVKNEATQYQINQSVQNTKPIHDGNSNTPLEVELTVNTIQHPHNEQNIKQQGTKHENKHQEKKSNWNNENTEIHYTPCCKCGKIESNEETKQEQEEEDMKLETFCCSYCCIKSVKAGNIKSYDGYDDKSQEEKDMIVARLEGDIWALGYVIARKRNKLPCSFALLLCFIYTTQFLILCAIIWGYIGIPAVVNRQSVTGPCQIEFRDIINGTIDATPYDFGDHFGKLNWDPNSDIKCNGMSEYESAGHRQAWLPDIAFTQDVRDHGFKPIWDIVTDFTVFIFPFTEILSFILLGFYISSSMTNPIIFFTIAHEYNQVKYFSEYLQSSSS